MAILLYGHPTGYWSLFAGRSKVQYIFSILINNNNHRKKQNWFPWPMSTKPNDLIIVNNKWIIHPKLNAPLNQFVINGKKNDSCKWFAGFLHHFIVISNLWNTEKDTKWNETKKSCCYGVIIYNHRSNRSPSSSFYYNVRRCVYLIRWGKAKQQKKK